MTIKFTSEELKNIIKQPKDSCPHLNYALQKIESENTSSDVKENVDKELYQAGRIIYDIIEWQTQWKELFLKNKSYNLEDPFVEAYIQTAEQIEKKEKIDLSTNINSINERFEEYQNEILNKDMSNDLLMFNDEEKTENILYIDMQKKELTRKIEDIREFAIEQRNIGENYKNAYKQISLINDFNDIIQPNEIIMEEQKNSDVFILGVLNHQKTTEELIKNDLMNDVEGVLFDKMSSKKKLEFIKTKIKDNEFDYKNIAYYDKLDDFQKGNKYKVYSFDKQKLKSNKKIKLNK